MDQLGLRGVQILERPLKLVVLLPQLDVGEPEDVGFTPGDLDLVQRLQILEPPVGVLVEDLILDSVKLLEMEERPLELSEALADVREKIMGPA